MISATTSERLHALRTGLNPRSVAVVGVSEDPRKYGTRIARSMIEGGFADGGFPGDLYFINPKGGSYLGVDFIPSLTSIGKAVDLAIVTVPSRFCPDVCREAAELGCPCTVVVANGFAETSRAEGARLQEELGQIVLDTGMRIVGPNAVGIFAAPGRVSGLGDSTIPAGGIAIVAQSGNVAIAMYEAAKTRNAGLSHLISLGNQIDVTFADALEYLADDPSAEVIALYIEGVVDLPALLEAVARTAPHKPVLVLRGGRSDSGARAAKSHTGSLADDETVLANALRAAGAVYVDNIRDLILGATGLSPAGSAPAGTSIAVISDGGGHATLAADAISRAGMHANVYPEGLQERLREILPAQAAVGNPVDLIEGFEFRTDIYQATVGACLADPSVDAALMVGSFGGARNFLSDAAIPLELAAAEDLVRLQRDLGKPLVVQSMFGAADFEVFAHLRAHGIPVVDEVDDAVRLLEMKLDYATRRDLVRREWPSPTPTPASLVALTEDASRAWLAERAPGLDMGDWVVVSSNVEAIDAHRGFGRPVVLKLLSQHAIHKSDVGGVELGLRTDAQVTDAWARLEQIAIRLGDAPRALMTPEERGSVEVLVGMYRHHGLGPVVMVGAGGVFTEAVRDRTLVFPPVSTAEVREALTRLDLDRVLSSPRAAAVLRDQLVSIVEAVADVAVREPALVELDLNPVLLTSSGPRVLDARVVVG